MEIIEGVKILGTITGGLFHDKSDDKDVEIRYFIIFIVSGTYLRGGTGITL